MLKLKFHIPLLSLLILLSSGLTGNVRRTALSDVFSPATIQQEKHEKKDALSADLQLKKKKRKAKGTEPFVPQLDASFTAEHSYASFSPVIAGEKVSAFYLSTNRERGPPAGF